MNNVDVKVYQLGYFLKWVPQETYYYSVKNCGFRPRPFRTTGTYSKYNSIDDKIDDLHYYTTFIKFGIGRATYDVSQEIRNDHITIDEGKKLIKKYDGEFPNRYLKDTLGYLGISKNKYGFVIFLCLILNIFLCEIDINCIILEKDSSPNFKFANA